MTTWMSRVTMTEPTTRDGVWICARFTWTARAMFTREQVEESRGMEEFIGTAKYEAENQLERWLQPLPLLVHWHERPSTEYAPDWARDVMMFTYRASGDLGLGDEAQTEALMKWVDKPPLEDWQSPYHMLDEKPLPAGKDMYPVIESIPFTSPSDDMVDIFRYFHSGLVWSPPQRNVLINPDSIT